MQLPQVDEHTVSQQVIWRRQEPVAPHSAA
jgi:hypothetical protein